jgi:hypothetical protein
MNYHNERLFDLFFEKEPSIYDEFSNGYQIMSRTVIIVVKNYSISSLKDDLDSYAELAFKESNCKFRHIGGFITLSRSKATEYEECSIYPADHNHSFIRGEFVMNSAHITNESNELNEYHDKEFEPAMIAFACSLVDSIHNLKILS